MDGRKSLRIAVRDALLSKKAFMAFALMGVTGNETYQIQVLKYTINCIFITFLMTLCVQYLTFTLKILCSPV